MSEELVENSRVLIVEDERITSLDLERILKDKGYTVIGRVDTGEEAVSRAVEETPDLILMDIMLAGPMDGISAAASISDQVKIPIIFLTAHNDQATLNRAQFTEPYGYILKPYRDAEVHAVIQMTLYRNRLERKRLSSNSNGAARTNREIAPSELNHDSIVALLKSSVVFSVFGSEQLDDLISAGEVKSISAGDIFIREGAINPPPFVVLSGRLGMLKSAAGGKELTVEVLHPGDLFGLIAAFEQVPAPLTSQAQLDTTVFIVPKTMFLVLLEGHPSASLQFAEYISNRLQASYNFSGSIAHGPAQARFAAAIWELLPPASEQSSETIIQVTRQELAKSAGITVETAVRLAKAMEKEGILGLGQRKRLTVLDRERLRQIAFPQM